MEQSQLERATFTGAQKRPPLAGFARALVRRLKKPSTGFSVLVNPPARTVRSFLNENFKNNGELC